MSNVPLPNFSVSPTSMKLLHTGTTELTITNKESYPVTYKIKTTTPARYVVRPRMGAIAPQSSLPISITHRINSSDTTLSLSAGSTPTVLRDRFKIECIALPREVLTSDEEGIAKIWSLKPKPKDIEVHCEIQTVGNVKVSNGENNLAPSGALGVSSTPDGLSSKIPKGNNGPDVTSIPTTLPNRGVSTSTTTANVTHTLNSNSTTETRLRDTISQLEAELKAERIKMETAIISVRAKDKELKAVKHYQKKRQIPLPIALALFICIYLLSWFLNGRRSVAKETLGDV